MDSRIQMDIAMYEARQRELRASSRAKELLRKVYRHLESRLAPGDKALADQILAEIRSWHGEA